MLQVRRIFIRAPGNRYIEAEPKTEKSRRSRSEEHTSELQSPCNLVCRLLLEKKKNIYNEPSLLWHPRHTREYLPEVSFVSCSLLLFLPSAAIATPQLIPLSLVGLSHCRLPSC